MKKGGVLVLLAAGALLTIANWPTSPLSSETLADRVVVEKASRRLTLFGNGHVLKSYRVSLGRNPVGHKQREGDNRTPEGHYLVDHHKPDSSFHRALHVSYPSAADKLRAAKLGVSPGGVTS
jgi:murein L,D-transpeptidase YafK